jgi:hypothetical protein
MKIALLAILMFVLQGSWAQCDRFDDDFDQAVEKSIQPEFSTPKNPVSVVIGKVLEIGKRSPRAASSEMNMRVDSVLHGPFRGKTLKLTAAGRAEFVHFDDINPGERYEIVFIATEEGNIVPHCGTYLKRLGNKESRGLIGRNHTNLENEIHLVRSVDSIQSPRPRSKLN